MSRRRYRSTNPARYFERQEGTTMAWSHPTWIERNGEYIVAALGALVIAVALGAVAGALVAGWLS